MRSTFGVLVILAAVASTAGCLSKFRKGPETTTATTTRADRCADTSAEVAERDAAIEQLQSANERQAWELLESRARIARLDDRLAGQQLLLEEAIHEVVRARAKQRSVESRAEAASEIAEAEIALKRKSDANDDATQVEPLRQLLQQASGEFDAANFGGALYLASQVKARMRRVIRSEEAFEDGGAAVPGEQAFSVPVPLAVTRRSNFREGPGTEFPVLRKVDPGLELTGFATLGSWVRVRSADGTLGWIHASLVKGV